MPRHLKPNKDSDRKSKATSEGSRAPDNAGSTAVAPGKTNPIATTADGGEEAPPISGDVAPATSQNPPEDKRPFYKRFPDVLGDFIQNFKVELLTTLLTLTLSLGQYFYSSINTRMTIANIWRDGYTSETRNRVTKFRHHQRMWKDARDNNQTAPDPAATINRLVDPELLFSKSSPIEGDIYLAELLADDAIRKDGKTPTNADYVQAALAYRNAIIECLNTMEVVNAVIESRPLPFISRIIYSGTLSGRYKDVILEHREELRTFIDLYRRLPEKRGKKRETPAWYALTDEESYWTDSIAAVALLLSLVLFVMLVSVLKRRNQTGVPSSSPTPPACP